MERHLTETGKTYTLIDIPEFPQQHREALKGMLKYPPEGSAK